MTRLPLKLCLSAAVVAGLSLAAVGAASAAPVAGTARGVEAQAMVSHDNTQAVRWVWRHHRRVWVPEHRRFHR